MTSTLIALMLKPFAFLVVGGLICIPARLYVERKMKPGRLRSILLYKFHDDY